MNKLKNHFLNNSDTYIGLTVILFFLTFCFFIITDRYDRAELKSFFQDTIVTEYHGETVWRGGKYNQVKQGYVNILLYRNGQMVEVEVEINSDQVKIEKAINQLKKELRVMEVQEYEIKELNKFIDQTL